MKILFISVSGDGFCLANKLAEEDNDVFFWVKEKKYRAVGRGRNNPKLITSWEEYVNKADFVLFDMVGMGTIADYLRKRVPVFGAGSIADDMELDRDFGIRLMEKVKTKDSYVDISPHKKFSSLREGIAFLEGKNEPYVFKPMGNKGEGWTFVAKETNEGLIGFMENLPKDFPFMLQQKIDGIEISTEGVFNGKKFLAFNHTIEKKRFMNGNVGPNTGCMGSTVWVCDADEIVENTLLLLESVLAKENYHGVIDVNCIVQEDKLWFLELTPRLGYCAIQNLWHLMEDDPTKFFYQIAKGNNNIGTFSKEFSVGVTLSMPPFPDYEDMKKVKMLTGLKVLDIPEKYQPFVWLQDVMYENDEPRMAGVDGLVGYVLATGKTVDKASKQAYNLIKDISIMNDLQYRTDITDGVEKSIKQLKEWEWL